MQTHEKMAKLIDYRAREGSLKDVSDDVLLGAANDLIEALKRHKTAPCRSGEDATRQQPDS